MTSLMKFFVVALIIFAIILIIVVLLQTDRESGLGTITNTASDTSYWGKNKSNTREGKLELFTKVIATIFIAGIFMIGLWISKK